MILHLYILNYNNQINYDDYYRGGYRKSFKNTYKEVYTMAKSRLESRGGSIHAANNSVSTISQKTSGKIKKKYFSGSTRFVYYVQKKPRYVYADYDITQKKGPMRYITLIAFILIFILGASIFAKSIIVPKHIESSPEYDPLAVIDDEMGVLEEKASLEKVMKSFLNTTGVSPYVLIIDKGNSSLTSCRSDVSKYSRNFSLDKFVDKKHWVITYVYDEDNPKAPITDSNLGEFHGTDTNNIITSKTKEAFMANLANCLNDRSSYKISKAFEKAFTDIEPIVMNRQINTVTFVIGIVICIFSAIMGWVKFGYNKDEKYFKKAVICPSSVTEEKCEHCGGFYVVGTGIACPHCEALFEYTDNDDDR